MRKVHHYIRVALMIRLMCCAQIGLARQEEIRIEGHYNNQNIFLQNPLHKTYTSFCVDEITLNGEVLLRNPKVSAIEVKLNHLPRHTKVVLRIKHKSHCQPKIVNPAALRIAGQTHFVYFYAKNNTLYWKVGGEEQDADYVVEYLNNGTWEVDGTVQDITDSSTYVYAPRTFVAGVNKFRVKYSSSTFSRYSTDVELLLKAKIITFSPQQVQDEMTLSERTHFEILDAKQNVILSGTADHIPLRRLKPGDYFIMLDGKLYPFIKR